MRLAFANALITKAYQILTYSSTNFFFTEIQASDFFANCGLFNKDKHLFNKCLPE